MIPPSSSTGVEIIDAEKHFHTLYETEVHTSQMLVEQRRATLAGLRKECHELLETKVSWENSVGQNVVLRPVQTQLERGERPVTEHDSLSLPQLKALRDRRVEVVNVATWSLLMQGAPSFITTDPLPLSEVVSTFLRLENGR